MSEPKEFKIMSEPVFRVNFVCCVGVTLGVVVRPGGIISEPSCRCRCGKVYVFTLFTQVVQT